MTRLLLSGVLYALAFPPFNIHFLAWIALVPLLSLERPRFFDGLLAGAVANLIIFFWLWKTFSTAQIGFSVTLSAWLALAMLLGIYFGVFAEFYGRFPNNFFRPLVAGVVWVLLEQARSMALTGFPWALFAHTQATNRPLLQWTSIWGESGISFLLLSVNAVLAAALVKRSRANLITLSVVGLTVGLLWVGGLRRVKNYESVMEGAPKLKVAILQGNIDQYQKWDAAYEADIRKRYEDLVQEAMKSKPGLIIWPESAIPGWFPNDKAYVDWVRGVVLKSGVPHLIGAVSSRNGKDYNSAFLITSHGDIASLYDKQHLVPFGEYIPFGGFLKRWIPYLGQLGTFDAGNGPALFDVRGVKIAPNICYEAIFSSLIQRGVRRGADVIVNITNDGWFLDSAAPEQHFVANIFRAVETGRPVVRAANTGISAVIDPSGKVLFRSPLLTSGVYVVDVPIIMFSARPKKTKLFQ